MAFEMKVRTAKEKKRRQEHSGVGYSSAAVVGQDLLCLVGMPLVLFRQIHKREEPTETSVILGRVATDQPAPMQTERTELTFEVLLAEALEVFPNPLLGQCFPWHECATTFSEPYQGALFTADTLLKRLGNGLANNFWVVVTSLILLSHTAEDMARIVRWACRIAPGYHPWPGAFHELPCLLHILLSKPSDGPEKLVTEAYRSELARAISYLA
eukprot:CAMPEP_0172635048 /NCGR_PEP_ID=MMETSP1068-20121228/197375_1 /TAXON_ID=35684 /ORGANISM="Pseudopedinella elastica, Strain CCMP716" /LENGTH=212 /DNA_ID=CAMNT_0013447139 /DNA_START=34 /DNA_END=669 /DNA_ORIENTATION=-